MGKFCIFLGMTVLGWVGWWLGAFVNLGTAYVLSGVGSCLGVYAGWKIHRAYL